jgi:hypothetical protein
MRRRKQPKLDKELQDNGRLLRAWRKFHEDELTETLHGPHGAMIERLMFILRTLSADSAPLLLDFVRGVNWSSVNYETRLTALHEINAAITKLREKSGLSPFDDGVPGQPDTVFRVVRSILIPSEVATAERTGRDVTAA